MKFISSVLMGLLAGYTGFLVGGPVGGIFGAIIGALAGPLVERQALIMACKEKVLGKPGVTFGDPVYECFNCMYRCVGNILGSGIALLTSILGLLAPMSRIGILGGTVWSAWWSFSDWDDPWKLLSTGKVM